MKPHNPPLHGRGTFRTIVEGRMWVIVGSDAFETARAP